MTMRWFARLIVRGMLAGVAVGAFSTAAPAAEDPFTAMRAKRETPPAAAPDLVLPTASGDSFRLADLRGKVIILDFFVTT